MAILLVEDNARLCASLTRGFGELDIPIEVANTHGPTGARPPAETYL